MNETMDIERLMRALDNDKNEEIININNKKISLIKNKMLQKLNLSRDKLISYNKSLKNYKYVDDLKDIQYGCYVRWITLANPKQIKLTNGGIICEIKVTDDGIILICKNYMNRFFQFKMSENLIFQKLTNQENIILSAFDYLDK